MSGEIVKNDYLYHKEFVLSGKNGKPILLDITAKKNVEKPLPVIIFCHGFKSFKDWGTFPLMAQSFAEQGFAFIKFNYSHNGTSLASPTDFVDLESFGNNNFLIELLETKTVIDFVLNDSSILNLDKNKICLAGHSRGGGISMLAGTQHEAVSKIVAWSPIHEFLKYWDEDEIKKWKDEGVMWIENSRTKQPMPLYYQYYENYFQHIDVLHIPNFVKQSTKPILVIHGKNDETLDYHHSEEIKSWNEKFVSLVLMENANHTFGGKHPFQEKKLPELTNKLIQISVNFFTE
jgi:uncharacterized protein